jgi:hypothetical protein
LRNERIKFRVLGSRFRVDGFIFVSTSQGLALLRISLFLILTRNSKLATRNCLTSSPKNQPQGIGVGEEGMGGEKANPEPEATHSLAGDLSPEDSLTVLLGEVFQG